MRTQRMCVCVRSPLPTAITVTHFVASVVSTLSIPLTGYFLSRVCESVCAAHHKSHVCVHVIVVVVSCGVVMQCAFCGLINQVVRACVLMVIWVKFLIDVVEFANANRTTHQQQGAKLAVSGDVFKFLLSTLFSAH